MAVQVEVWGKYALFSRPEMKTERVSYDVMTPSAARGILDAIYYHPGLFWRIDKIRVCNPIRFSNIRRNEVELKMSADKVKKAIGKDLSELYIAAPQNIVQRAAMVLTDVRYIIEAHFEMTNKANATDNEGKFLDIMRRRLEKGQCFHQPYFGTREFPLRFRPWDGNWSVPEELAGERDLGWMLYDMDYSDPQDIRPMFFRARMQDGLIDLRDCEVKR
ncbi:MAG: type I-C CRISPR-associated protein Cas5c [Bacillota bacterium]|nr:type I-C CRISPR-associated protein Cas5c [Bacillota bacterium]